MRFNIPNVFLTYGIHHLKRKSIRDAIVVTAAVEFFHLSSPFNFCFFGGKGLLAYVYNCALLKYTTYSNGKRSRLRENIFIVETFGGNDFISEDYI